MRQQIARVAMTLAIAGLSLPAAAQSQREMTETCATVAMGFYRDFTARTDMQYGGRRVDGTHSVNGRIYLETRYADFACSFDRRGTRITEFFADGRVRNIALPGPGSGAGSDEMYVAGLRHGDLLNVRSGPGTGNRVVGALANGDRVRSLGCRETNGSRWCEIETLTDVRERGWVNARYLTREAAIQLPETPPTASFSRARVRFAPGASGAELTGSLAPSESRRYVLGARRGQDLYVHVATDGRHVDYQIFNPDGSFLLDRMSSDTEYRGRLWQSGDHVIEVINRSNRGQRYNVIFGVR